MENTEKVHHMARSTNSWRLLYCQLWRIAVHTWVFRQPKARPIITEAEAGDTSSRVPPTRLSSQKLKISMIMLSLRRPILPRLRLKALMKITMALGFLIVTVAVLLIAHYSTLGHALSILRSGFRARRLRLCRHECADRRWEWLPDDLLVRDAMSATFPVSKFKYAACSGERYRWRAHEKRTKTRCA